MYTIFYISILNHGWINWERRQNESKKLQHTVVQVNNQITKD